MSIIVNGITLPTTGDYLQVNGVLVDTVIANGINVWEKQKTLHVLSNGQPVEGNYSSAWRNPLGYATSLKEWGVYGHSSGGGLADAGIRFYSGKHQSLKVRYFVYVWGGPIATPQIILFNVTSGNTAASNYINGTEESSDTVILGTDEKTYSIAQDNHYDVKITIQDRDGANFWYTIQLLDVWLQ